MKVVPLAQAQAAQQQQQPQASNAAQDARARAMAKLMGGPSTPVQNQNQVSPEEHAAVVGQSGNKQEADTQDAAPANAQEKPPTAAAEEPEVSSKFAELAKREKALRARQSQQEQALKAREEAIAKREAELQSRQAPQDSTFISKDQFMRDPIKALNELGLTYDDITQGFLDASTPQDPRLLSQIKMLEEKLAKLEGQTQEWDKKTAEQQQQAYEAAVNQLKSDTKALVESDDSFEMIKATDSISDVVELIERTYKEDGVLLSVQDAAQEVENYLIEEALKLAKTGKVQQKLKPVAPAATEAGKQQQPGQTQQQTVKTLTNSIASSRQLSARERAIMAFKGEKQS